ncbi:hypothetical protein ACFFLS_05610 [Flavobacterium procerum]|uniref:Uncharacterized protein n=1 Tax=Flavobacterium procerum TaxID=1455569 RepID=A0ABV6BM34_9FLAO
MINKNVYLNLKLSDFVGDQYNTIEDFTYADVLGKSTLVGYHIIFFNRIESELGALIINDLGDNHQLIDLANRILKTISFDFNIGQKYSDTLTKTFGAYQYKDSVFEDITRFYFLKKDFLIILGISDKNVLKTIEIVMDSEIIRNRMN